MTNKADVSNLSFEELHKKIKTSKTVTGLLAGMLVLQLLAGIYLTFLDGFNVFIVLPFAFLPIVVANYASIKKMVLPLIELV